MATEDEALQTQGSQIFVIDPSTTPATVVEVGEVTKIDGIDAPISSVETTTLASDARRYRAGIAEPATASIGILFNPSSETQTQLHALRNAGTTLHWAVGYSDGEIEPALNTGGDAFDVAAVARSFVYFDGFMTSWPFTFDVNSVVSSDVGIQLVNRPTVVRKA